MLTKQTLSVFGREDGARCFKFFTVELVLWRNDRDHEIARIPNVQGQREPFLAFHGTKAEKFESIMKDNSDRHLKVLDDGCFGEGCYFTTNLVYASNYINLRGLDYTTSFQLSEKGRTAFIYGALLKPGRTYRITDMS